MSPEEQRIAIAEACGWTRIEILPSMKCRPTQVVGFNTNEDRRGNVPDYLNDLNAMHEAEKVLMNHPNAGELVTNYINYLEDSHDRWLTSCFATASQRAEAFLRTLNLWES